MNEKSANDKVISKKMDELITTNNTSKINVAQHEIKVTRHDNIFLKLIFLISDEISTFLLHINLCKQNDTLDADFKVKINRMTAQLNNAKVNKDL